MKHTSTRAVHLGSLGKLQTLARSLTLRRLAPQDYHRFHSPVDGVVGKMTLIDGEYYTVNPQAIRTTLDVYGENVRKIVPIHSEEFGTVMTVWVGAMREYAWLAISR
jgi:phosphatidylserine decarboxylase precursor